MLIDFISKVLFYYISILIGFIGIGGKDPLFGPERNIELKGLLMYCRYFLLRHVNFVLTLGPLMKIFFFEHTL